MKNRPFHNCWLALAAAEKSLPFQSPVMVRSMASEPSPDRKNLFPSKLMWA